MCEDRGPWCLRPGRIRSTIAALVASARGIPLFFRASPRTPLRSLGIIALDVLHRLRRARRLPSVTVRRLSLFLDFQGCANAEWDDKPLSRTHYDTLRARLIDEGLGPCIESYLHHLQVLESTRPAAGGTLDGFDDIRRYREAVARLSLQTAAAIALSPPSSTRIVTAADCDGDSDVDLLVRVLIQCQVVDDVLDYETDMSAGLPSFLTACAPVAQSLALTDRAVRGYLSEGLRGTGPAVFPFRVALLGSTAITMVVLRAALWRYRRDHAWKWGNA